MKFLGLFKQRESASGNERLLKFRLVNAPVPSQRPKKKETDHETVGMN